MGKWSGQADMSAETSGGGNKFSPAPRGIYTIQVSDYKDGETKDTKRPKVDLTCEIADEGPEFGKRVWMTLTHIPMGEKGHGLMVHYLHAFGIALDGDYEFDTSDLQGRQARALLGVTAREKIKDGRTYVNDVNFIEALYTDKHPEPVDGKLPPPREPGKSVAKAPASAAAAPAASRKEEVPF